MSPNGAFMAVETSALISAACARPPTTRLSAIVTMTASRRIASSIRVSSLQALRPEHRKGCGRGEKFDQRLGAIGILGGSGNAGREHRHRLNVGGQRTDDVDAGHCHQF